MNFYFAPLEGITNATFRTLHAAQFPSGMTYFSPFITPRSKRSLTTRDSNDVHPDNNKGLTLIPQILTNHAEGFLETTQAMAELGYPTVNLNLGCPSGTVVSKGRGSGFLAHQPELERFLEEIYAKSPIPVSVKTRIGVDYEEEWEELLPIFNRFPIQELIIHPRLRKEYYKGTPHRDIFRDALRQSVNPVVYNGDLFTVADIKAFEKDFPEVKTVMIGRGLITNPALIREYEGGEPLKTSELRRFHDDLLSRYEKILPGERSVLFKMKEMWNYWGLGFPDAAKQLKQIKKAQHLSDLKNAAALILRDK